MKTTVNRSVVAISVVHVLLYSGWHIAAENVGWRNDGTGRFVDVADPPQTWSALKDAEKEDVVKIIGFDGQPDGKQAIKDGKIYADPIQHPDKMGKMVVDTIVAHFNGDVVPPVQLIPATLYKKEDAMADKSLK